MRMIGGCGMLGREWLKLVGKFGWVMMLRIWRRIDLEWWVMMVVERVSVVEVVLVFCFNK